MPQIFTAPREPRDAAPAHRGSDAEPIKASSAAAGFSCAIRCSPIRNASYPASRRRTMSVGPRIPLSATATTSSGIAEASESAVSTSTVIVRRSRLLTPTTRAPTARARSSSPRSWTSTSTSRRASSAAACIDLSSASDSAATMRRMASAPDSTDSPTW